MKVTEEILKKKVQRINSYFNIKTPKYDNVGSFLLDYGFQGVTLEKVTNKNGGTDNVFRIGYISKKELYMYLEGFEIGLELMEKFKRIRE